jgi:hypothetical protein
VGKARQAGRGRTTQANHVCRALQYALITLDLRIKFGKGDENLMSGRLIDPTLERRFESTMARTLFDSSYFMCGMRHNQTTDTRTLRFRLKP